MKKKLLVGFILTFAIGTPLAVIAAFFISTHFILCPLLVAFCGITFQWAGILTFLK